jgi:hypothetical protein
MTYLLRRKPFIIVAAVAAATLAAVFALTQSGQAARAASTQPPATCSLATLQGTYAWNAQSVQLAANGAASTQVPFAVAGVETFDGQGHSRGFFSQAVNGKISSRIAFTSRYTTNPDCTGTETITDATGAVSHFDQYTVPTGSRLTFAETDPGVTSSGVEVKDGN